MYLYVFVFLSFGHARPEPLGITGQCARLSLISYFSPRDTTVISYVKSYFPNSLSLSFLPTDTFAFIFPRIEVRASNYFFFSFIFFFLLLFSRIFARKNFDRSICNDERFETKKYRIAECPRTNRI